MNNSFLCKHKHRTLVRGTMFHLLAIFASMILLSSIVATTFHIQYSGAQTIVPVSKEFQVPDIQLNEPTVKGDNENEPEVEEEEPTVKDTDESEVKGEGEDVPEVQGEDESTSEQNETESEVQPEVITPKKEVGGSLDIANATQQLLQPVYEIKITFDAIKVKSLGNLAKCGQGPPGEWDIGVYVQGKLTKLDDMGQPLKVCEDMVVQLKNAEATVDIPGESVESPKDYQPLSIFTAGSQLDKCVPKPLPAELPEVRKILSDKGSTRPFYANAEEKIRNIQEQISNGCIPKTIQGQCGYLWGGYGCYSFHYNSSLSTINILEESPGYGKYVPKNTVGNPPSVQIDTCTTYHSQSLDFCLYYTIYCPLCPSIRVH
jgi:hypothetical protein